MDADFTAVTAGTAALAAIASAVTAGFALGISHRTAKAQDRSASATEHGAAAQLRSAEATDALRRVEIERGHNELGPQTELVWCQVGAEGVWAVGMTNLHWRGYRCNVTLIHDGGRSRSPLQYGLELPSRGSNHFFPVPQTQPKAAVREALEVMGGRTVVELEFRPDDLWRCPCERANDYGHWRETRQLPALPAGQ